MIVMIRRWDGAACMTGFTWTVMIVVFVDLGTGLGTPQALRIPPGLSKSKHSKRKQTVNWTWEVACWFSFWKSRQSRIRQDARARVRFCFWKASAKRFFLWEVVRHARACSRCAHARARGAGPLATTADPALSATRRQRPKLDKCRVADKKQTDKPTNKHTLLFYRYRRADQGRLRPKTKYEVSSCQ